MQSDSQVQRSRQSMVHPVYGPQKLGQFKTEIACVSNIVKYKIKTVPPGVLINRREFRIRREAADAAKKELQEPRYFIFGQLAEANCIGEQDRYHPRGKFS